VAEPIMDVCGTCQTAHPVQLAEIPDPPPDRDDPWWCADNLFRMAPHPAAGCQPGGKQCEGTGTSPQTIIWPKEVKETALT